MYVGSVFLPSAALLAHYSHVPHRRASIKGLQGTSHAKEGKQGLLQGSTPAHIAEFGDYADCGFIQGPDRLSYPVDGEQARLDGMSFAEAPNTSSWMRKCVYTLRLPLRISKRVMYVAYSYLHHRSQLTRGIPLLQLKPYVVVGTRLSENHKKAVFSSIHGPGGITPERFLRVAQEQTYAAENPDEPVPSGKPIPAWMQAQINLKMRVDPLYKAMPFTQYRRDELALNAKKEPVLRGPRQLEIVEEKPASPSS